MICVKLMEESPGVVTLYKCAHHWYTPHKTDIIVGGGNGCSNKIDYYLRYISLVAVC